MLLCIIGYKKNINTHDGSTYTHIIVHEHAHSHYVNESNHTHKHAELFNTKKS